MQVVFNKKIIKCSIKGYEDAQEELRAQFKKTKLKSLTYLSESQVHRHVLFLKTLQHGKCEKKRRASRR